MEPLREGLQRLMMTEAMRYRRIRYHVHQILKLVADEEDRPSHEQLIDLVVVALEQHGAPLTVVELWRHLQPSVRSLSQEGLERVLMLEWKRPSQRVFRLEDGRVWLSREAPVG